MVGLQTAVTMDTGEKKLHQNHIQPSKHSSQSIQPKLHRSTHHTVAAAEDAVDCESHRTIPCRATKSSAYVGLVLILERILPIQSESAVVWVE